jgi:SAM-dependent methyltransferase
VANSAQYVVPYISDDSQILDIGCGPGTLTADLASLCPNGSVTGIDTSSSVIEVAMASNYARANLSFDVVDAYHLPYPDNSFDVVHAHQVLQHVPEPVVLLKEMSRVVTRNGVIAARDADYERFSWAPDKPELRRWLDTYRIIARLCGGEPDAGRYLLDWASEAHLNIVAHTTSVWEFDTTSDVKWWGEMWADRVLNSNYSQHALAHDLLTDRELLAIHNAWIEWSREPSAHFVIPHGEIVASK